jgi:hypothetical protein
LFTVVTSQEGAFFDLSIEVILDTGDAAPVAGPIPAAATPGQFYVTQLDGLGGVLVPVDYLPTP